MTFRLRNGLLLLTIPVLMILGALNPVHASDPSAGTNINVNPRPLEMADLVLQSTSGHTVSLSDFKGKVVLLHFWSIQCPACRMEEPLLDQLKRSFEPLGLEILGVNLVDPPDAILRHASANHLPYRTLYDGGRGFSLRVVNMGGRRTAFIVNPAKEAILEVPGFPTTYIIDCRGSAVGYSVGAARWDTPYALNLIRQLIEQRKTCTPGNLRQPIEQYSMRGPAR
jgi:thiol-disulfide isomerase/thioredoxin